MFVLSFFAFLAGIFTVLSPCILPILPILLSAGTQQGKLRPLGIISGLICSFTFFTLSLTALVFATGVSPTILRHVAVAVVFVFGLVMIFPKLSEWFAKLTTPVASLGQRIQGTSASSGFGKGFILGIALGLLWTPCAGPILAAITTLVATQGVNFSTFLVTVAYSIGAGIPMFLIAYGGNKIIQSSRLLSSHAEGIRQFFGCLMVFAAVAIGLNWDMLLQQKIVSVLPPVVVEDLPVVRRQLDTLTQQATPLRFVESEKLSDFGKAPEPVGIVNWINSPPLSLMQLRGKVVLIDFWTYSCINCLRTLPYIKQWYADYKDDGLVIIGVHTPEFEFEKEPKNVAKAVMNLGIDYPVAQDNNFKTWLAYNNQYWPAHYLIDQKGNLRMVHFGEGGYVATENAIRELLGKPPLDKKEQERQIVILSPETYLGLHRGGSYAKEVALQPNALAFYDYKEPLHDDQVGLKGKWRAESERITAESDSSYLDLNFRASKVYLVLSGKSSEPVKVYLDNKEQESFLVDGDRKYDVVSTSYGRHHLSLKVPYGVSAYVFTFGADKS
jgi:cytochrome c biogenesis protein CcdA/thiol-disulfide isomerase/thioredoxin